MPIITTKYFSIIPIGGITYSDEFVSGSLLRAEILNPEEIMVLPGETMETVLEIRGGISIAPKSIKILFKSFGEKILEKDITIRKEAAIGTAVDVDAQKKLIDIYMVIPAVGIGFEGTDDYWLELSIDKKGKEIKKLLPMKFVL
jgi:hypothetical protein